MGVIKISCGTTSRKRCFDGSLCFAAHCVEGLSWASLASFYTLRHSFVSQYNAYGMVV